MKNSLHGAEKSLPDLSSRAPSQHPRRLTTIVAALMLGGGGGAFALASLAPDAAEVPVRIVKEAVQALPLQDFEQSPGIGPGLFRSELTRSTDTADTLFKRMGVDDAAAATFLRSDAVARQVLLGRSGRNVTVETTNRHAVLKLSARWSPEDNGTFNRLVIEKTPTGFESRLETEPLTSATRLASGTIESSLFSATDAADIPDAIAVQVAEIFSGDIDFNRSLRKGDRFSIVYETLEGDGEPLRTGRVLSAEFVNNGKTFQAMWFQDPGVVQAGAPSGDQRPSTLANAADKGGYYTLDGQSLRRAFLAAPLKFSRITSSFKLRFHPILHVWRRHEGVDYAAPTGTAVRGVGDGVVDFAGVQNGYGKVVILKHRNNYKTVYAHLSRINVRKGQSVSQGDTIGAVGATGWATGPHLHFEYRVNNVYKNPQSIARENVTVPLAASAKPAFARLAAGYQEALAAASTIGQSRAQ